MKNFLQLIVFIMALFFLSGCDYLPFGYTPIGDIKLAPGKYLSQEIKVRGTVTQITKLPFIKTKNYTIRDRSGEIIVITEDSLPVLNETISIKATVKTSAIIDEEAFGLRLQETKKLPDLSLS